MESSLHLAIKNNLYWSLVRDGYIVHMEKMLGGKCQPDLLLEINDKLIAVEIQKSPISPIPLLKRMARHTEAGAYTLWLIPKEILDTISYRRRWCELIQKLQNGVVFLPTGSSKIQPARIDLLYGGTRKYIDCYESSVDIDEVLFEKNDVFNFNVAGWPEWWIERDLDLYG